MLAHQAAHIGTACDVGVGNKRIGDGDAIANPSDQATSGSGRADHDTRASIADTGVGNIGELVGVANQTTHTPFAPARSNRGSSVICIVQGDGISSVTNQSTGGAIGMTSHGAGGKNIGKCAAIFSKANQAAYSAPVIHNIAGCANVGNGPAGDMATDSATNVVVSAGDTTGDIAGGIGVQDRSPVVADQSASVSPSSDIAC